MTSDRKLAPEEAHAALESAERMRRAGTRRGRAPRWLCVAFALMLGGFVAAQSARVPGAATAIFIVMTTIFLGGRNNVMAMPRRDSSTFSQVLTILGFAAVVGAAAIGAAFLRHKLGLAWAPLALGVLVAAAAFVYLEFKTRAWAARQSGAGNEA